MDELTKTFMEAGQAMIDELAKKTNPLNMEYHIEDRTKGGQKVACFLHEQHRDICLEAIKKEHAVGPEDHFYSIND